MPIDDSNLVTPADRARVEHDLELARAELKAAKAAMEARLKAQTTSEEPIDPMPLDDLLAALNATRRELEGAEPGSLHHKALGETAQSLENRVRTAKEAMAAAEVQAMRAREEGDEALGEPVPDPPRAEGTDDLPQDHPDEEAPAPPPMLPEDTVGDEDLKRVLELNGFMALRNAMLGAVQAVANFAPEELEAAIAYNRVATARLRLMPDEAQAAKAIRAADRHHAYLEQLVRWRKDVKKLEERLDARERLSIVR